MNRRFPRIRRLSAVAGLVLSMGVGGYALMAQQSKDDNIHMMEQTPKEAGDPTRPDPFLGDKVGDVRSVRAATALQGPPLTLRDGRVMMWDTASPEKGKRIARAAYSKDNGRTWSAPRKLFDFPSGHGDFSSGACLLSREGSIHVFGLDYYGFDFKDRVKSKSYLWHARGRDGGKTWEPVQKVDFGLEYTGSSNNAFQLSSGRIIAPVSGLSNRRVGPWVSLCPYSDDDGKTWHKPAQQITMSAGAANWYESGAVEPVGFQFQDGRVWLLPRSQDGWQWETFSKDDGLHWTPARHSRFISNQSAMAVFRLKDGKVLLIWNNCGAEGQGSVHWGNAERAVLCAAVSSDEGRTWRGWREVGRVTTNTQVAYPYATQMPNGRVLLFATGFLIDFDPAFLSNPGLTEDFRYGVRRWSTLEVEGVSAVADPDGSSGTVMKIAKPRVGSPSGACLNIPFGRTGEVSLTLRIEKGFQGAHLTLSDHYDPPGLARDAAFPLRIEPNGRILLNGSGGSWLDTPGDLTPGKWHTLKLRWNTIQGKGMLWLDGVEIAHLEQYVRTPGICYLRLRSTAPATDIAGLLVKSVSVQAKP